MLEKEFAWFEQNEDSLRARYLNKHIVIVDDKVIGVYDTAGEAYRETAKSTAPGTFMVTYLPQNKGDSIHRFKMRRYV